MALKIRRWAGHLRQVDNVIPTLAERSRIQLRKALGLNQPDTSTQINTDLPVAIELYFESLKKAEAAERAAAERAAAEAEMQRRLQAALERAHQEALGAQAKAEAEAEAERRAEQARTDQTVVMQAEMAPPEETIDAPCRAKQPTGTPFSRIEKNPWLELCAWMIVLLIEAASALAEVLGQLNISSGQQRSLRVRYLSRASLSSRLRQQWLDPLRRVFSQPAASI